MKRTGRSESLTSDETQERIISGFIEAGDAFEQFDHLLQLAADLPELPNDQKTSDCLIEGCQSQVWLHVEWEDGRLSIRGDSDTLMVRGIIRIFILMFENKTPEEIVSCPIRFVNETELASIFDSKRKTGVSSIFNVIRLSALSQMNAG